jgi:hypothetical protein
MKPAITVSMVVLLYSDIPISLSLAVPAGTLEWRQKDVKCEKPGLKATSITAANETSSLDKRSFNGVRGSFIQPVSSVYLAFGLG